ncbi:MAG: hypothetical protein ACR2JM_08475 [Mycobacterium sp.]
MTDKPLASDDAAEAGEITADAIVEDTETVLDDSDELLGAQEAVSEELVVKPPRRPVDLRKAAVAGAFVALLGLSGFLGWQVFAQHQLKQAADEAQRAAVSYAQVLTSIDSNKVDENFKEVLDGATGEFKDMYSQSSVELRQLLIENKANAHGVVVESAVQSVSKNKAVVLLFVDQSVSNTKLPDPRIDRSRMKMTLEKVDGAWRASKIELP